MCKPSKNNILQKFLFSGQIIFFFITKEKVFSEFIPNNHCLSCGLQDCRFGGKWAPVLLSHLIRVLIPSSTKILSKILDIFKIYSSYLTTQLHFFCGKTIWGSFFSKPRFSERNFNVYTSRSTSSIFQWTANLLKLVCLFKKPARTRYNLSTSIFLCL